MDAVAQGQLGEVEVVEEGPEGLDVGDGGEEDEAVFVVGDWGLGGGDCWRGSSWGG